MVVSPVNLGREMIIFRYAAGGRVRIPSRTSGSGIVRAREKAGRIDNPSYEVARSSLIALVPAPGADQKSKGTHPNQGKAGRFGCDHDVVNF